MNHTLGLSPTPSELELGMGMTGGSRSMGLGLGSSMGASLSYGMGRGLEPGRREHSVDRDSLSDDEARRLEEREKAKSNASHEHEEPPHEPIGDISESQLFPMGSDLF